MRHGIRLGEHIISFDIRDNIIIADIAIDYLYKIGFIDVFRYKLRAREVWHSDQLQTVRSKTNHNGTSEFMNANRDELGLAIEGSRVKPYRASPGSIVASHWNVAQLNAPMINPQDGTRLPYKVSASPTVQVSASDSKSVQARHFTLTGDNQLELWYDSTDVWTGLRAQVFDGSVVTYQRTK